MKLSSGFTSYVRIAACASALLAFVPAKAEDWKASNGTIYTAVKVVKVENNAVIVLSDEGGARVSLDTLPADIQQEVQDAAQKVQAADNATTQAQAVAASRAVLVNGKVKSIVPLGNGYNGYILAQQYGGEPTGQTILVAGGVGQDFVTDDLVTSGTAKVPCDVGMFAPDGVKEEPVSWYYAGIYQYTTIDGASVTCRIYSPSLEWAVRNLQNKSK